MSGSVLAAGQSNTLNAEINTYYDFSPVTEKTPLKYQHEPIDHRLIVVIESAKRRGFTPDGVFD